MITTIKGDLLKEKHGIIVHGCNCLGVMGAGIALQIATKWPNVLNQYRMHLKRHGFGGLGPKPAAPRALGTYHVVPVGRELLVANAITQIDVGGTRPVSYDAVAQCFEALGKVAHELGLPLKFPAIGSGLGGGKWPIVAAIIDESVPDVVEKQLFVL